MDIIHGKIPPQAVDLEESILGSIIAYPTLLNDVRDRITKDSFYKDAHQIIYEAIIKLDSENKPFDIKMISEKLKETGELEVIGGTYYLTTLQDLPFGIEERAEIVHRKHIKRRLIQIASDVLKESFKEQDNAFDIIAETSAQLEDILKDDDSGVIHIEECVKDVMNVIDNNIKGVMTGTPTGFEKYDKFTRGEQNGDLVVIAGETSQGKTSLALCKAFNQALMGYNVAIFSYEMTRNQITARLMALAADFSAKRILMDKLGESELELLLRKTAELVESNIYIIEVKDRDYDWLKNKIKSVRLKYKIDSIIIDYIQLITVKNLKRNEQIGYIANDLKFLAKHENINIPITLLSQLKRSDSPEPTLSRLKESGDIENAADLVVGIWRPEHYGIEVLEIRNDFGNIESISTKGIGIMKILKGRNTGLKTFVMNWTPEFTKYSDYEKDDEKGSQNPF